MGGRTLTSNVLAQIALTAVYVATAVRFTVNGNTYTKITGDKALTFDGFTFAADGTLLSIGSLTEDRDNPSATQVTLALTDPTLQADVAANNAATNGNVYLYLVFMDATFTLIDFLKVGPYLFSTPQSQENPGKKQLVFAAEHYMNRLDLTNGMRFTDNDQQARHTGDTFWQLSATLAYIQLIWGAGGSGTSVGKDQDRAGATANLRQGGGSRSLIRRTPAP